MFCQNCGKQLSNDALFCPSCGDPTKKGSAGLASAGFGTPQPSQYAPAPPPPQQYAQPAPYTSININQPPQAPQPQHVSGAWYLLPFFLGFIGGIIGWAVVKDRNPGTAKNLLIFGIVWTIIEVVIYYVIGYLIAAMLFGG